MDQVSLLNHAKVWTLDYMYFKFIELTPGILIDFVLYDWCPENSTHSGEYFNINVCENELKKQNTSWKACHNIESTSLELMWLSQ